MPRSERRPWGILAGLFLVSVGFIAYVIVPATVMPLFVAEYGVDKPTASASISAVFLTWALLQIPGGFVLDRHDNRKLVLAGVVAFLVVAGIGLVVESYGAFLVTRLLSGAAVVIVFVGSITILGQVLPERRRAVGLSIYIASPPTGLALAQFFSPRIAATFGWRGAVVTWMLVSLAGLAVAAALLDRPILAAEPVMLAEFRAALVDPAVLLVSLASFCTYAIWTFLNTWMPSYGTDVLGIDLAAAGAATALVPLAGIVARPGGGWLSERLGGRHVAVIVASFLATTGLLVLLSGASTPTAFAILLVLSGLAVNLGVGLYLVQVNELAGAATQGTSLSVLLTFSQVGNLVAPVAGGWLIASVSWTAGFGFGAVLGIAGVGAILLAPRT